MSTAYTRKHVSKWTHRKDWVLNGEVGTIKEHAARLGETPQRTRIFLQIGKWPFRRSEIVRMHPKSIPLSVSRVCPRCKVEFLPTTGAMKFCSVGCRIPKKPRIPKPEKILPPPKPLVRCAECLDPFLPRRAGHKFCSERCQRKDETRRLYIAKPVGWDLVHHAAQCCGCPSDLPVPRRKGRTKCDRCQKYGTPAQRRKAKNENRKRRLQNDPGYKLRCRLSNRLREMVSKRGGQKVNGIMSYIGCSMPDLMAVIESKWTNGMNWGNYGVFGWHVDHLIPCALFDLAKEEHCHVCFHYSNLRPLWHMENSLKRDLIVPEIPEELKARARIIGIEIF